MNTECLTPQIITAMYEQKKIKYSGTNVCNFIFFPEFQLKLNVTSR